MPTAFTVIISAEAQPTGASISHKVSFFLPTNISAFNRHPLFMCIYKV
jgi:hypothetical protein